MKLLIQLRPFQQLLAVWIGFGLLGCSESLPSESDARQSYTVKYGRELNGGVFTLDSFKKINAQESEVFGVKMYTVEYEAQITYLKDHSAYAALGGLGEYLGPTIGTGRQGEQKNLRGQIIFEKTENGWRPTGRVLNPSTTYSAPIVGDALRRDTAESRRMEQQRLERERRLAEIREQERRERERREEEKRAREAEAKRRLEERKARFAITDPMYNLAQDENKREWMQFRFKLTGGLPPYEYKIYLNDKPLTDALARYQVCRANFGQINRESLYDARLNSPRDPGEGTSTVQFLLATGQNWPFAWPSDHSFPIKIKIEIFAEGGRLGPKTAELEIPSGPQRYLPRFETRGYNPIWVEIDGQPEKPAGDLAGQWRLVRVDWTGWQETEEEWEVKLKTRSNFLNGEFAGKTIGTLEGIVAGQTVRFAAKEGDSQSSYFGVANADFTEVKGGWGRLGVRWQMTRIKKDSSFNAGGQALLDSIVQGGRLGLFRHGTRCTGFYNDKNQFVDIQPEGTASPKPHTTTKALIHAGVDIAAPRGTEIRFLADGTVVDVIDRNSDSHFKWLGFMVMVKHETPTDGRDAWSLYLHLNEMSPVKVGETVKGGQTVVGQVGSTGMAMGDHLHLEVRHFSERFSPRWKNIYGKLTPVAERTFDEEDFRKSWSDPLEVIGSSSAALPDVTGRWNGEYENPPFAGPQWVSFVAIFNQEKDGFTGNVTEPDSRPGNEKKTLSAEILKGRIDSQGTLSFYKKYLLAGQEGPVVQYKGKLAEDGKTIEGRWYRDVESRQFKMKRE